MLCEKCKKELKNAAVSVAKRHNKNGEITSFMLVCLQCAEKIKARNYETKTRMSKMLKHKEHGSRPAKKSSKM